MAENKIIIELGVDDKGSAVLKKFSDETRKTFDGMQDNQTSFLEKLKGNWVAASAAIAAGYMLVNKAMAYVDVAAKALQVESSFKIMADSAGASSESIIASMKKATKETIDDSDLMQKAVKLMTLGYDPKQIERFSAVVITASQIAGITAVEAFDELGDAIANRMPKALVRMGAVTREQMKIVNEAITAGADSTVLFELAMANLELKQKMLQGTQDAATISLQRYHAQQKETGESIGKFLIVAMQKGYGAMQMLAAGALGAAGALANLLQMTVSLAAWTADKLGFTEKAAAMRSFAESMKKNAEDFSGAAQELADKAAANMSGIGEVSKKATAQQIADSKAKVDAQMAELAKYKETAEAAKKAAQEKEAAEKSIIEAVRKARIEIESASQSQYEKDIIRIDSEVDKYRKAGVDETFITQFAETEKTVAKEKSRLKWIELGKLHLNDESDTLLQETLMQQNSAEKTKAIWESTFGYDNKLLAVYLTNHKEAMDRRTAEIEALSDLDEGKSANNARIAKEWETNRAKWILNINKDMAEEIGRFTRNEFNLKEKAIEEEYRLRKLRMGESLVLERWREIELKKLNEQRILRSDDFFAGMRVAYEQDLREQKSWGERGAEIFRSVFGPGGAIASTFQSLFVDIFKGQLKTAADYFNAFKDIVLGAIAKMIAEWIAFQTMLAAGQALGFTVSGGGGVGNLILGTTANAAASSASGGAGGGGGGVGTAGTGLIGLAQQAYTYLAGGGAAATTAATSSGVAAVGSGATGGAGMAAAEASAAGYGTTAGAGAAAGGSLAGAGLVGAAVAAYIMIGQKYFGSGVSYDNPFREDAFFKQWGIPNVLAYGALTPYVWFATHGDLNSWYDIIGKPFYSDAFKMVQDNSFFSSEGLRARWRQVVGHDPTSDELEQNKQSGMITKFLMGQPEFVAMQAALAEKYPHPRQMAFNYEDTWQWYAKGGIISEPVIGRGTRSGQGYVIGEDGPEAVVPLSGSRRGGVSIGNIQVFLDGKEIGGVMKIIADGVVVARNRSGINATMRVYQ